MSLKVQSVQRQVVLDMARLYVENAAQDGGGLIAATIESQRLLDRYPDCGLSIEEIQIEIARLSLMRGIVIEFGKRP